MSIHQTQIISHFPQL